MEIYVGTSGWMYSWNKEGNFKWYVENSNLNAVELNASFYRFPFPNQIAGWSKRSKNLRWSIKVNRLITHKYRLKDEAIDSFNRFQELFKPMEDIIDFYLFQLPPSFKLNNEKELLKFFDKVDRKKIILEFRNRDWFNMELEAWGEKNKLNICSVDSPEIKNKIIKTNEIIYIRFHGRETWYMYDYSEEELLEIVKIIKDKNPKKVYAFFNNNHSMLKNAQMFFNLLKNV